MALKKRSVIMLLASILLTACAKEPSVPVEKLFTQWGCLYCQSNPTSGYFYWYH